MPVSPAMRGNRFKPTTHFSCRTLGTQEVLGHQCSGTQEVFEVRTSYACYLCIGYQTAVRALQSLNHMNIDASIVRMPVSPAMRANARGHRQCSKCGANTQCSGTQAVFEVRTTYACYLCIGYQTTVLSLQPLNRLNIDASNFANACVPGDARIGQVPVSPVQSWGHWKCSKCEQAMLAICVSGTKQRY